MLKRNLAAIAAILALTLVFFWKLWLTDEYVWFDHPDMCYIEIPRLQFQAHEFHQGRFPLWDPAHWMGQPLIGQAQPGPLFPLNIALLLMPLREGYLDFRLLNLFFVIVRFLAALCAYALCRDLRIGRAASVIGACAFAFGGFVGSVAWLDVVNGAIWTPAICLFLLRAARGVRPIANAALCGAMLGLAWLSGHHEIPILVTLATGGAWLYALLRRGRDVLAPAIVTYLILGLVAAMQIVPTFEYARLSMRWVGVHDPVGWGDRIPYIVPSQYSLPPRALLDTFLPAGRDHADTTLYLGLVLTALAAYAVLSRWRVPPVRWFVVLMICAVLFAMGAGTPLHGVLYSLVPVLGKARMPVRAIHLMNFALAVLAAYGADRLIARRADRWIRRMPQALAGLGAVLILGVTIVRPDPEDRLVLCGLIALALATLVAIWHRGRMSHGVFLSILLLLVFVELNPVITRTFASRHDTAANRYVKTLREFRDIAEFLRSEPAPRRVAVNEPDLPTNFGDWYGVDTLEGYSAGVSVNLLRLERHTPPVQDLLGVTHYVAREPNRAGQVQAFQGASGVKVFRNPTALPRAWSVHAVERMPSDGHLRIRMQDANFDPRRTALLLGDAPPLEACDGDRVEVVAHAPNKVRIRTRMQCRGLVTLSDTFYPGWRATIDGRETPVLETYGALRGVVVPGGDHELTFVFRPASVYMGGALSAMGILITAILAIFQRRSASPATISKAGKRKADG